MGTKNTAPVSRSGRFSEGPSADLARYTESISFDKRLWRHDIMGSKAHAAMLHRIGLLSAAEARAIHKGLDAIAGEIESGKFQWREELEDVHMNIEAELTRREPAGAKLHTGRSRNDQVAVDMRLWLRDETNALIGEVIELQRALLGFAEREQGVLIPGYTHMQRAQPVWLAHHLLAYVEMFQRDIDRLRDSLDRTNVCPLGAGAIAGSTLPLDREFTARTLGFVDSKGRPKVAQNSMDAVSDRDFIVEFCSATALAAIHLSRLSEDLVLWAGAEFNFIRIDDAYTTGSSLMPQKKNPDVAELTRGKTGRVVGNLVSVLTLLKGLPMTYNRDLQEDKERLFDSTDTIRSSVRITAAMLTHTHANRQTCAVAASDPALLATDLADYLVSKGVPFRQAHHAIGNLVAVAEKASKALNKLAFEDFQAAHPAFETDVLHIFDPVRAMQRRKVIGSPGTGEVKKQIARWKKLLR